MSKPFSVFLTKQINLSSSAYSVVPLKVDPLLWVNAFERMLPFYNSTVNRNISIVVELIDMNIILHLSMLLLSSVKPKFLSLRKMPLYCLNTESSEHAIAKMKNLDESKPAPVKHKDVNTFKNNQVKFTGGASSIPPENMKCNILKARLEEDMKKGWLALPPIIHLYCDSFPLCKAHAYSLTQWSLSLHFSCPSPLYWFFLTCS